MTQHRKTQLTAALLTAMTLCTGLATASPGPVPLTFPVRLESPQIANHPQPAREPVVFMSQLVLPRGVSQDHPLLGLVRRTWEGQYGDQPAWRLPLLVNGLKQQPRTARLTAFSSRCADGGGPTTRWGTRVRYGICAADPRYWGPGSVIWVAAPVNGLLIVEDTGSAVKGRDRFDVALGSDAAACSRFGVRRGTYVPLYVAPLRRNWGSRPRGWQPPVLPMEHSLVAVPASRVTTMAKGPAPVRLAEARPAN